MSEQYDESAPDTWPDPHAVPLRPLSVEERLARLEAEVVEVRKEQGMCLNYLKAISEQMGIEARRRSSYPPAATNGSNGNGKANGNGRQ